VTLRLETVSYRYAGTQRHQLVECDLELRPGTVVGVTGANDSGKSTLALQMDHNHAVRGRSGRIFTSLDRAGAATLSSRLGLQVPAIEVPTDMDLWLYVVDELQRGARIDYLVCDEAQFYTAAQIDQLARIGKERLLGT